MIYMYQSLLDGIVFIGELTWVAWSPSPAFSKGINPAKRVEWPAFQWVHNSSPLLTPNS
jgi:hypothetical protein